MDDMDIKEFIKGYEQGYWLKRGNRPELPAIMERAQEKPTYAHGLKSGAKEAEREKVRERLQNNNDISSVNEKGLDIE